MNVYKLTASQLATLLQVLGALVADYIKNPKKPMDPMLVPLVKTKLQWKDLPGLDKAVDAAVQGGSKLEALYELGNELKDAMASFRNNQEYTTPELQMLRALRSYLSTDSETALVFIRKNASVFKNQTLSQFFLPEIPESDHEGLSTTVKKLVGREGKHLTQDEAAMIKETNPKLYQRYADLRKAHNLEFKAVLSNYVRGTGKPRADYQEVYKFVNEQGFTHSMVPGFVGSIDDQGRWYTTQGELLGNIPNLATYTHVVMNDGKDPENQWVFKAFKEDGNFAYGYTANFKRDQSASKYEHVALLMSKIDSIRKRWMVKVKNFNPADKESVAAVVLEILYLFAARVGSDPGRGVGTLLRKNASVTTTGINLAYLGKKSVPTKHILKSNNPHHKLVIDALTQMLADKKPSAFIFTAKLGNRLVRVTPADINKAFHTFGAPSVVTVHKIRTCRGTSLFRELVEKDAMRRPPTNEKDALARYKEMTEKVGKLLNHKRGVGEDSESVTGTTAAISYIDSSLQIDLWKSWGFRPPVALEKLLSEDND